MSNFSEKFKEFASVTESENGGKVFSSTGGEALLDLYSKIGGMRKRSEEDIVNDWHAARKENEELADNLILYTRNIRNCGLGERRIGRILFKELAKINPEKVKKNFQTIVDTGRWDDLFCFVDTPVEVEMWNFIKQQWYKDLKGMNNNEPISILAKWLPSVNTSSRKTRELARRACEFMDFLEKRYRKCLSDLRKYLQIVERKMSLGQWNEINFENVPSIALSRYINSYNKHCAEKFAEYKSKVQSGEKKINASTLYPYDIVKKYFTNRYDFDAIDEEQWKNLPNYINEGYEVVVMADVSGSMTCDNCQPLATSIGLATYFAQRNKGAYHNMYLTFTNNSHFITIKDTYSLKDCINVVQSAGIGYSTNIDSAFQAIYEVAKEARETPKAIVIISDGEFDFYSTLDYADSIVSKWNKIFISEGFNPVKVISWNVANRHDTYIARACDNISYCSGYGIGPFNDLTTLIQYTPYEGMVNILSKPEYQWRK